MTYNKLTPDEERVILHKGTEPPFSGKYYQYNADGTYTCKRCGAPLYRSTDKFDAGCGWPSFDAEIPGAVKRTLDADGMRTEITCAHCGAHLGHVFEGEGFTPKNVRYCVNSISMNFMPASETQASDSPKVAVPSQQPSTEKAYFAGGCFWGTEYMLEKAEGVISLRVGYMGGHTANPTYQQVCDGRTGHAETAEIVFDPTKTGFEKLARLFFEIHDPTQKNRQGPDIGDQYRSAVFYVDDTQKQIAAKLIDILKSKGYDVVTELAKAGTFWPAEDYHQNYYDHTGKQPYCHFYQKRF
ncbi:MAG: bifunctional methionine sulfoxide reductase B/A protein [candidate division Zixibacteria bacterium]|nr:bifunctional methionine sulfoxide reductase B/A protein [candidate division Zixibacteria bacterium]